MEWMNGLMVRTAPLQLLLLLVGAFLVLLGDLVILVLLLVEASIEEELVALLTVQRGQVDALKL